MKRMTCMLLTAALLLSLAGCSCQHEWTAPGCETPAVCTKCEETGEAALGHDFAEASCEEPETCTRCGLAQGETLPHQFGEWEMRNPEMYRSCIVCGAEERTDMDYELYLQRKLPGQWDFAGAVTAFGTMTAKDLNWNAVGFNANFSENGTCRIFNGTEFFDAAWEYKEHTSENETYITVYFDDGSQALMCLQENGGEEKLIFFYDETQYTWMTRMDQLAAALVGTWAGFSDGELYTLKLEENRSLSGNIAGEYVTGTWHLKPMEVSNGYRSAEMMLILGSQVHPCNINLGSAEESLEEHLEKMVFSGWYLPAFRRADDGAFLKLEAAQAVADRKLPGTWVPETLEITNEKTGEKAEVDLSACSVSFAEDGTFTAVLDREYTGEWRLDAINISQSNVKYYDSIQYNYAFSLGEGESYIYLGSGYMNLSGRNGDVSIRGSFKQISDTEENHEAQADEKLIGTWNVIDMACYQADGSLAEISDFEGYKLTAKEDGTFTAWFGEEVTGEWYFSEYEFSDGYNYGFLANGADGGRIYHIEEEGFLKAFYTGKDGDILMTLTKE